MSNPSSFYSSRKTSPSPQMREFNVGLPEDDLPFEEIQATPKFAPGQQLSPEERQELQRMRQESRTGPSLNDHAKKRIEILTNIGRLTKDVELEGRVFSMRTLKNKEDRDATMAMFAVSKNDFDAFHELRRQKLAHSLFAIDGQALEVALGGTQFELKLDLLDEMEEVTVAKLYNEFQALHKEVSTKYGLVTEADVKEVAGQIKK